MNNNGNGNNHSGLSPKVKEILAVCALFIGTIVISSLSGGEDGGMVFGLMLIIIGGGYLTLKLWPSQLQKTIVQMKADRQGLENWWRGYSRDRDNLWNGQCLKINAIWENRLAREIAQQKAESRGQLDKLQRDLESAARAHEASNITLRAQWAETLGKLRKLQREFQDQEAAWSEKRKELEAQVKDLEERDDAFQEEVERLSAQLARYEGNA